MTDPKTLKPGHYVVHNWQINHVTVAKLDTSTRPNVPIFWLPGHGADYPASRFLRNWNVLVRLEDVPGWPHLGES